MNNTVKKRYLTSEYLEKNPTWDCEDAPWKVGQILKILNQQGIKPESVIDIGCGSGHVLSLLRDKFPEAILKGYDISPGLSDLWEKHVGKNIELHDSNPTLDKDVMADILLALDVIEHVSDPFNFLESLKGLAKYYLFHIPLDLSSVSVALERPLINVRDKVGHIHYYTRNLALKTLTECGFEIIACNYTDAYRTARITSVKTMIAIFPRIFLDIVNKDLSARLLGGQTIMVLTKQSKKY